MKGRRPRGMQRAMWYTNIRSRMGMGMGARELADLEMNRKGHSTVESSMRCKAYDPWRRRGGNICEHKYFIRFELLLNLHEGLLNRPPINDKSARPK